MVRAWYVAKVHDDTKHLDNHLDPPAFVDLPDLKKLTGVTIRKLNVDEYKDEDKINALLREYNGVKWDILDFSREKLPNYDETMKRFYQEHQHPEEEIRLCLEGSAYFDIRDVYDKWIRVWVEKGDLVVLPSEIFHRFTLDKNVSTEKVGKRRTNLDSKSVKMSGKSDSDSRQRKLEDLKVMIRSLVIPYQDGVRVNTLLNDYVEVEGRSLPYKDLGYRSVDQLLLAMPDVVRFSYNKAGEYVLFPVADENCAHIQMLVKEQKNTSKARRSSSGQSRQASINFQRKLIGRRPVLGRGPASKPLLTTPLYGNMFNFKFNPQTMRNFNYGGFNTYNNAYNALNYVIFNQVYSNQRSSSITSSTQSSEKRSAILPNQNQNNQIQNQINNQKTSSQLPIHSQQNIVQLLALFQFGIKINEFDTFYQYRFGPLNYKQYGFDNITQCLKAHPNVCSLSLDETFVFSKKEATLPIASEANKVISDFKNSKSGTMISTKPTIIRKCSSPDVSKITITTSALQITTSATINSHSSQQTAIDRTLVVNSSATNFFKSEKAPATSEAYTPFTPTTTVITTTVSSVSSTSSAMISVTTVITSLTNTPTTSTSTTTCSNLIDSNSNIYSINSLNPTNTITSFGKRKPVKKPNVIDEKKNLENKNNEHVKDEIDFKSVKEKPSSSIETAAKPKVSRRSSVTSLLRKVSQKLALNGENATNYGKSLEYPTNKNITSPTACSSVKLMPAGCGQNMHCVENETSTEKKSDYEEMRRKNEILTQELQALKEKTMKESPLNDDTEKFPAQVIARFKRIISRFPKGVPVSTFYEEYEKDSGFEMDPTIWGFTSPIEVFYSLPSLFLITPPDISNEIQFPGSESEHILYDVKSAPTEALNLLTENYLKQCEESSTIALKSKPVDEKILLRILKILQGMNEGLSIEDFIGIYYINYREELTPSAWNYESYYDFFVSLTREIPIYIQSKNGNEHKIYLEPKIFREWLRSCIIDCKINAIKMFIDLPSDVVLPGEIPETVTIPDCFLVQDSGVNTWLPVLITSAINPDCIWVQLKGDGFNHSLEQLMCDLDFYNEPQSISYKVPPEFLMKNFICCARFQVDQHWHRVRITRVDQNNNLVTVYFLDYGGVEVVKSSELRLLKREFFNLPAQAINVKLHGIKPKNKLDKWRCEHTRKIILTFSEKDYWLACLFFPKNNSKKYEVFICDTNKDEDVYIHEKLILEGEAMAVETSSQNTSEQKKNEPKTEVKSRTRKIKELSRSAANLNKTRHIGDIKNEMNAKGETKNDESEEADFRNHYEKFCFDWLEELKKSEPIRISAQYSQQNPPLFQDAKEFKGSEMVKFLGKVKIDDDNGTIIIKVLSVDNRIYVIEEDIDRLLVKLPLWKSTHYGYSVETLVLKDGKEKALQALGLDIDVKPSGVILFSMKSLLDLLESLRCTFIKSAFTEFFRRYEDRIINDQSKLELLYSLRSLRLQ